MDVRSGKWERMNPQGEPPSPRAAHAAAAVGSMVVIQVDHHSTLLRYSFTSPTLKHAHIRTSSEQVMYAAAGHLIPCGLNLYLRS